MKQDFDENQFRDVEHFVVQKAVGTFFNVEKIIYYLPSSQQIDFRHKQFQLFPLGLQLYSIFVLRFHFLTLPDHGCSQEMCGFPKETCDELPCIVPTPNPAWYSHKNSSIWFAQCSYAINEYVEGTFFNTFNKHEATSLPPLQDWPSCNNVIIDNPL